MSFDLPTERQPRSVGRDGKCEKKKRKLNVADCPPDKDICQKSSSIDANVLGYEMAKHDDDLDEGRSKCPKIKLPVREKVRC